MVDSGFKSPSSWFQVWSVIITLRAPGQQKPIFYSWAPWPGSSGDVTEMSDVRVLQE